MFTIVNAVIMASSLMAPMTPGPYEVGFRIITILDPTRESLSPASRFGRQVPVAVWYPTVDSSTPPITLRDYVIAGEQVLLGTAPPDPTSVVGAFVADAVGRGIAWADLDRLLATVMSARQGGRPSPGRFPLVLFAHASVETEGVTAEYLASYGYVVAAVKSRGAGEVPYRLSRENLDAMVSDLDVAATRMRREPYVRRGPIGVIGMSNGSIAAVALQLKRADVGAIISLDGGIGENAGGAYLRERSNGSASRFTAPILHLYTPVNDFLNLDQLRSYRAAFRVLVSMPEMRHRDFLAYPAFDRLVPGFSGPTATGRGQDGFVWVNRYTLHFLDAYLQRTRHGGRFLAASPQSQSVPAGLLAIEHLAAVR